MPPVQVAVCGPRDCTPQEATHALEVGRLLAERGACVLCGGGPGVMAAVAEGVTAANGFVIGIRPDTDPSTAREGLSAVIYTGMGEARNAILINSADAVIVIGGSWGTLSELALANRRGTIPIITLGGWKILDADDNPVDAALTVDTPEAAVHEALSRTKPHP
ncbi:LOG family protein [Nocardia sp. NPDC056000]|uniref:SLOG cluster 4 domain-containing protein n=1 Tax=Nocardia sp. NPDC056000 TaxID=3345674 RepID=UPI0035E368E3